MIIKQQAQTKQKKAALSSHSVSGFAHTFSFTPLSGLPVLVE